MVVTKSNGNIRSCLDARKLNSLLIPDYECARSVEELFQNCNGEIRNEIQQTVTPKFCMLEDKLYKLCNHRWKASEGQFEKNKKHYKFNRRRSKD